MLRTVALQAATVRMARNTLVRAMASESRSVSFKLQTPFTTHRIESPAMEVEATREDLLKFLRDMLVIRRMEITCDNEYKMRNIRGFLHLYDGQEAVAVGTEAALTREDDWITTYRCHGASYVRGDTPKAIFAELFGYREGTVGGKGGSMHLYIKKSNFYGGAAIVGAQMPVGAGLAFANRYLAKDKKNMNVSVAMCGDGSVNQGQVWEAANMAALWKLPVIFLVENNQYGMGTSVKRSSCNTDYYTHGNVIPGIRCDGMDVLAVRECMRFSKAFVGGGNGPLFVEMDTYRYHGHSMSDPGVTYRNRDEVSSVRKSRDCIELTKQRLVDAKLATEDEIKEMEKEVRLEVQQALEEAKKGSFPDEFDMYKHMYHNEVPSFVRGVEHEKSLRS